MDSIEEELRRIRSVYISRDANVSLRGLYEPLSPAALFTVQEREWTAVNLLRRSGMPPPGELDILDVGCGSGIELLRWAVLGARPERLAGIDLMPERIAAARVLIPAADLRVGSAHELPWADASFDLITQFTAFSSIVHAGMRSAIAAEMGRVLRPDGRIFWWDMRSAASPDLVAIDAAGIRALFPGFRVQVSSDTLSPRFVRHIVPRSRLAGLLLEQLPWLRSHYAALIMRPSSRLA
jgi:ubiquinone/menaquinone biosynthesis C-methylase UbiE